MWTNPKPCPSSDLVVRKRPPTLRCLPPEEGQRDVRLRALHVHIHANHAIGFRQPVVGLDRVVEQVAEDAAQIEFRNAQLDRNMGVHAHVDAMRLCKRHLAAQNRVGHRIAGLDRGIQRLELGIETVR